MMKKVVAAFLAVFAMLSFAGCGRMKMVSPRAEQKLKVVLCVARRNDLSFQQSAYEGLLRVEKELGQYYETELREMGNDTAVWEQNFIDAAASGASFVAGMGYQNKQIFETLPLKYPNTRFILFDQAVDYSSGNLSNVLTVLFDANESGFLAGAVAAYWTNSGKALNKEKIIGFVGGMNSIPINNFLVGYAEGARRVDRAIQIKTAYIGDFMDTERAKTLALAQIAEGADIVFQVAGSAGNGVIEAASEIDGVMAIGVDADQYQTLAGTGINQAVITSSLKRLDNALFKIMSDYANDPASIPFGTTVTYGLGEAAVGIVFNDNLSAHLLSQDIASVQDFLVKIQSGDIRVSRADRLTPAELDAIVNNTNK
ncbi:MAG: BMP family ABC transporter substrate-binding protein [Treponema sp.]|jgi:basic membrane protein A|nr:BMP family ABC transporter substrate-binding protein [Treponema sp.]